MQVTFISFVIFLVSLMGCKNTLVEPNYSNENTPMSISVDRPGTYTFKNLQNKNIYITLLNTSRSSTAMHKRLWSKNSVDNIVTWEKHGAAAPYSHNNVVASYSQIKSSKTASDDNIPIVEFISKEEFETIYQEENKDVVSTSPRSGIPVATKFNSEPPRERVDDLRAYRKELLEKGRVNKNSVNNNAVSAGIGVNSNIIDLGSSTNVLGKDKKFWVNSDTAPNEAGYTQTESDYYGSTRFKQISATCVALTEHCAIYVAKEQKDLLFSSNTQDVTFPLMEKKAKDLANYFEKIYTMETSLFGKPFRMDLGPSKNEVEILIYDIDADVQSNGVVGFFWGKDYFTNSAQPFSNETEMFYLDSSFVKTDPQVACSTLIHEFQHMINFHQKIILGGMYSVETWYNEMMSMIAEDMIYPIITPNDNAGWVMNVRMENFLRQFRQGSVTHWIDGDVYSYSYLAAFGGYLTRNYGGARFVHELSTNAYQGVSSIANAIETLYPKRYQNSSAIFTDIFLRFPEVMFYTKKNLLKSSFSFEVPVSESYIDYCGSTYALKDFKVWPFTFSNGKTIKPYFLNMNADSNTQYRIRLMSFMVFEHDDLKNVSGDFSITFSELADGGIKYQIYVVSPPDG